MINCPLALMNPPSAGRMLSTPCTANAIGWSIARRSSARSDVKFCGTPAFANSLVNTTAAWSPGPSPSTVAWAIFRASVESSNRIDQSKTITTSRPSGDTSLVATSGATSRVHAAVPVVTPRGRAGSSTGVNATMSRFFPSSRTVKSAAVNPRTGVRFSSSSDTSICTTPTRTRNVGAGSGRWAWVVAAASRGSANQLARGSTTAEIARLERQTAATLSRPIQVLLQAARAFDGVRLCRRQADQGDPIDPHLDVAGIGAELRPDSGAGLLRTRVEDPVDDVIETTRCPLLTRDRHEIFFAANEVALFRTFE